MSDGFIVANGKLVVASAGVAVESVLACCAEKMTVAHILRAEPDLTEADVAACIAHDRELAKAKQVQQVRGLTPVR